MPRSPNASSPCHLNEKSAAGRATTVARGLLRARHQERSFGSARSFDRVTQSKTPGRNKTFVVELECHVQANLLKVSPSGRGSPGERAVRNSRTAAAAAGIAVLANPRGKTRSFACIRRLTIFQPR